MEQRIPLSQGETVQQFIVDRVIGFGASCLVYEAHYLDRSNHPKEIILKECYPCNAGASRIGNKIIWSNAEEQEKAFLRFDNAYEIAAKIQNVAGAKSVSVYSLDKLKENGTEYVATIPNGTSYDNNESKDIADIIRTALALTNAVGLYHKAGYLHLDIKPSNFIATEDQTGKGKNIVLFDVDTVVSQNDIQEGNLRSVSYSKECAAPEQKMQQIKKLCPATDLFAVGAVLFERIMNRPVDSSDSTLFSEWEFDSRFDVKKVNPKAKRLLTEIFHKTLAANVKRRYQSAEELTNALDELLSVVTNGKPYLISNFSSTVDVIGRRNEIDLISNEFSSGKRAVFLHGVGGIGKSTLAVAYANEYQKNYDAVLFLRYRDSLEALLDEIEIYNCETTNPEERRRNLLALLDQDVLFIIANFDVSTDQDDYLFDLLQFQTNIIFTTRTDFSDTLNGDTTQIEVTPLSQSYLIELFSHFCKTEITAENENYLLEMFSLVGYNTYAVELLARQKVASDCLIETLAEKVADGLYGLKGLERIRSNKDGRIIKKTVPDIIRSLYNMANLDENQKQTLRNLYLLRFLNIDRHTYLEFYWGPPGNMDVVNDLVEIGWVQKNNRCFYLHPLVEELVNNELKPCEDNCGCVFHSMRMRINRCFDDYGAIIDIENYTAEVNCKLIREFLHGLDFQIQSNYAFAIQWIMKLVEDKDTHHDYPLRKDYNALLSKLESFASTNSISLQQTFEIDYILFLFSVNEFYIIFYQGSEEEVNQKLQNRREDLYTNFNRIIKTANQLTGKYQEESLNKIYSIINRAWCYLPKDFFIQRYHERPDCFDSGVLEETKSESNTAKAESQNVENDLESKVVQEFLQAKDKVQLIRQINTNSVFSLNDKIVRIGYCTDYIYDHLYLFNGNWLIVLNILDVEESLLEKAEIYNNDYGLNMIFHCVAYAKLDNQEKFIEYSDYLFDCFTPKIDICLAEPYRIKYDLYCFYELLDVAFNTNVCSWVLPHYIKFGEELEKHINPDKYTHMDLLCEIYRCIKDCAECAVDEKKNNEQQKNHFKAIANRYKKQINKIQDVDFNFKSDDE